MRKYSLSYKGAGKCHLLISSSLNLALICDGLSPSANNLKMYHTTFTCFSSITSFQPRLCHRLRNLNRCLSSFRLNSSIWCSTDKAFRFEIDTTSLFPVSLSTLRYLLSNFFCCQQYLVILI